MTAPDEHVDVLVIGAGQAGLAVGFYLRRTSLRVLIVDAEEAPGGAWRHTWDSLHLFSPARYSSLPGWLMPVSRDDPPHRDDVIAYLDAYERRYALPVRRPWRVASLRQTPEGWIATSSTGARVAGRAVVSATGTWGHPSVPEYPGRSTFRGVQVHSAAYRRPEAFRGLRVMVVGGGNSGAQILADLDGVAAHLLWMTAHPPRFLPDDVDGRVLFDQASAHYRDGGASGPPPSLGDIVMVPSVRRARELGLLHALPPCDRFDEGHAVWQDGRREAVDAIVWCTGFRPALDHLHPHLPLDARGRADVEGTRARHAERLWLVGYGNWTGFASATLIGVGRSARETVQELVTTLSSAPSADA